MSERKRPDQGAWDGRRKLNDTHISSEEYLSKKYHIFLGIKKKNIKRVVK